MELYTTEGRLYIKKDNRWYQVMAIFSNGNAWVNDANAYMEKNEEASLLIAVGNVAVIVHENDIGVQSI